MILWKNVGLQRFIKNMDISLFMVHSQQVEETRLKKKNREFKRAKSYEGGTSKGRLEIQDNLRLNKRVFNEVISNLPMRNKDSGSNTKCRKGRTGNHLAINLLVPSLVRSIGVSV